MELSQQIAIFLHNRGIGVFDPSGASGNIFINTIPNHPDESIGIYTTGGPGTDPKNEYGVHRVQLLIRTIPNDPRRGEKSAREVIEAINGFNSDYLADGGHYIIDAIANESGPNNIGQDKKSRFEYSQNFIIEYTKGGH
jgi:hypothetical protein